MSNWFNENLAKLATAWQAGFLFTVWIFQNLTGELGVSGLVQNEGALILIGMSLTFTAYLFTLTKIYTIKDKVIDVTPKEQFTMKQAVSMIQETFGLKASGAFVPVPENGEETDVVRREEFQELTALVKRTLDLVSVDSG